MSGAQAVGVADNLARMNEVVEEDNFAALVRVNSKKRLREPPPSPPFARTLPLPFHMVYV